MQKPAGVNQALIAIWATIAVSAIASLINSWMGVISGGEFTFSLLMYGLVCIIPYKKANVDGRHAFSAWFIEDLL